ncbi:DAO-domain-containing protein [Aspergillus ellipticus CBS 707.79]|uniref:DAO-domain-containing protein n=1 Tax=Aspergillus ellipticus CBS 707.79 TaxID=1448320 RepID=A0A319DM54_9EURO|nr:DAO-domain-containing protein [Aspergillus ellipticus CBS 707.79]
MPESIALHEQSKTMTTPQSPASSAVAVEWLQPSLPRHLPNLSYWHRTTDTFPYLNNDSENAPPAQVPIIIIGTGISGALAAFKLIEAGTRSDDILLIEARQAVSGSSGRNAGHIRPDAFRGFSGYAAVHGTEQALKICDTENTVLKAWRAFIENHQIPCDFGLKQTFDVCMTDEIAEEEARNLQEYVAAGGSMDGIQVYGTEETALKLGIEGAIAAYKWAAASIHPAKLAQWLLTQVVEQGVHLWTHCPVTDITKAKTTYHFSWTVHTPRGEIATQQIIHCTNAHAGVLLPQLLPPQITPVRVQVQAFQLPSFAGDRALNTTMAVRFHPQLFYGLSRSQSDGRMIVSVGKPNGISFDDSSYKQELVEETLGMLDKVFSAEKPTQFRPGEGVHDVWTGLVAMTPDRVPYIGAIDELPGQFICAGFNGHGMANIFACVEALVTLVRGGTWEETTLPECYRYRKTRVAGERAVGRR